MPKVFVLDCLLHQGADLPVVTRIAHRLETFSDLARVWARVRRCAMETSFAIILRYCATSYGESSRSFAHEVTSLSIPIRQVLLLTSEAGFGRRLFSLACGKEIKTG